MRSRPYQPALSTFARNIMPGELSKIALSGGALGSAPHEYYLGINSTIPFVQFDSGGTSKVLSWGEVVSVEPGQQVAVRNASYMPGDIQIQSGHLPVGAPGRITVPATLEIKQFPETENPFVVEVTTVHPCDTRRAKKAYFVFEVSTLNVFPTQGFQKVSVLGYSQQHTKNPITKTVESYLLEYELEHINRPIPLGTETDTVMVLEDFAHVRMTMTYDFALEGGGGGLSYPAYKNAYYLLEY